MLKLPALLRLSKMKHLKALKVNHSNGLTYNSICSIEIHWSADLFCKSLMKW